MAASDLVTLYVPGVVVTAAFVVMGRWVYRLTDRVQQLAERVAHLEGGRNGHHDRHHDDD